MWRAELLPPLTPTPQVQKGPTTLKTPPPPRRAAKAKSCTSGSGGGLFALLALGGMVCFVNYHAVVKPVRPNPTVNFQPTLPRFPAVPHTRYTSTPVPNSPGPVRWVFPPTPPAPQPPSVVIEPPQAPIYWGPYDQRRAWRNERPQDDDE